MNVLKSSLVAIALAAFAIDVSWAAEPETAAGTGDGQPHMSIAAQETKWQAAPTMIPRGAQVAVLEGDPSKEGAPYTVRLKFPGGYKIPPHSHPTDENVTVISGAFGIGMGDKLETTSGHFVKAGGFVRMPQGRHHFAWVKGRTIIQVHGLGPFALTYVNPADDPRNQQ